MFTEATARGILQKKLFLKILQYSEKKTCVGDSLLTKEDEGLQFYWGSNSCVFLWILRNFCGTPILKNICELQIFYLKSSKIDFVLQTHKNLNVDSLKYLQRGVRISMP